MNPAIRAVLKRLHYPLPVMLLCVRWYAAYPLSLRQLEEMMAERGLSIDHVTVHRWALKLLPVFALLFRSHKKPVGGSWRLDETYILIKGEWKYLYRAVDSVVIPLISYSPPNVIYPQHDAFWSKRSTSTTFLIRSTSIRAGRTRQRSRASITMRA